eukprot:3058757-Prymnesium_polylepis.1
MSEPVPTFRIASRRSRYCVILCSRNGRGVRLSLSVECSAPLACRSFSPQAPTVRGSTGASLPSSVRLEGVDCGRNKSRIRTTSGAVSTKGMAGHTASRGLMGPLPRDDVGFRCAPTPVILRDALPLVAGTETGRWRSSRSGAGVPARRGSTRGDRPMRITSVWPRFFLLDETGEVAGRS